ncbi:hypothetical protein HOA91_03090 [Candidatus Woesearchaeota archaeon]|jgi:hypothetical protein|nr:hypothetical protein [Candidatus Woesearchaeota archaeon]
MGSLKAKQLLFKAAKYLDKERSKYSRQEIVKKINEIKYLSTQKKVPRLTLRKEIIHLENRLGSVLESEKELLKHKNEESVKVKSLKKQVLSLKNKLTAYEDKNLDKKVNKLSHLLGEFLAKQGSKADVELSKKVLNELEIKDKKLKTKLRAIESKKEAEETPKHARYPVLREKVAEKTAPLNENEMIRVKELQNRLAFLKKELLQTKDFSPEQIKIMKEKANLIETKLNQYYEQHPELMSIKEKKSKVVESPVKAGEIKHTLMFGSEKKEEKKKEPAVHEELPLPPPPQMTE